MKIALSGICSVGAYFVFTYLVTAIYRLQFDVPGIDVSSRLLVLVLTGATAFVCWSRLND